jgi:hypothetical protein
MNTLCRTTALSLLAFLLVLPETASLAWAREPASGSSRDSSRVPLGLSVGPLSESGVRHWPVRPPPRPEPRPPRVLTVDDLPGLHVPSSGLYVRLSGHVRADSGGLVMDGQVLVLVGATTVLTPSSMAHRWSRYHGELQVTGWLLPNWTAGSWKLRARVVRFERNEPDERYEQVSAEEVIADPLAWDGRRVRITGEYRVGFEVSSLGGRIWLSGGRREGFPDDWGDQPAHPHHEPSDCRHVKPEVGCCLPPPFWRYPTAMVEAWGRLETSAGHYGHLGSCVAQLNAERIVYQGETDSNQGGIQRD